LRQSPFLLEQGLSYEISYDAYADANRNTSVILSDQGGTQYHYIAQALTTTPQNYTNTFTMASASDANSIFSFTAGNSSIDVYINNIVVKPLNCVEEACLANINLDLAINTNEVFHAGTLLSSSASINADVEFKAGQEVRLNEPFMTNPNFNFLAEIEDCQENICSPIFNISSPSSIAYESTVACNVSEGISGMWASRANPDVFWHIADHDYDLHADDHYLFAVSSTGNLLWSGELSGVNSGDKDIEAITGYQINNVWYLAIWENRYLYDEIQVIVEPTVTSNQTLAYGITVPVDRIIHPQGGIGDNGNVESLTWDESDDNMYLVERGGSTFAANPTQAVWRIANFSSLNDGALANEIFVANIQGRPEGVLTTIHVGVGDAAISPNGEVFVMMGVGGSGINKNEYLFWWTRDVDTESWANILSNNPIPSAAQSYNTTSMGENIAFSSNLDCIYYGNDWASGSSNKIYKHTLNYISCE